MKTKEKSLDKSKFIIHSLNIDKQSHRRLIFLFNSCPIVQLCDQEGKYYKKCHQKHINEE